MGEAAPPNPGLSELSKFYIIFVLSTDFCYAKLMLKFQPSALLQFDIISPKPLTFIKLPNNGNIGACSEAHYQNQEVNYVRLLEKTY